MKTALLAVAAIVGIPVLVAVLYNLVNGWMNMLATFGMHYFGFSNVGSVAFAVSTAVLTIWALTKIFKNETANHQCNGHD